MRISDCQTLNNGVKMPYLGLGMWQIVHTKSVFEAIHTGLDFGYRLIDTAKDYGNEKSVGKTIKTSNINRSEIFVTTKLWIEDQGYENTLKAFDKSLKELELDYIDLYLIHWPAPKRDLYIESWKAMEKLYKEKRMRAIGISNFLPEYIEKIINDCEIIPAVNQIEVHPYLTQNETIEYCRNYNIAIEGWSPLAHGKIINDQKINDIAKKYYKTSVQLILKWHLQRGIIVVPKGDKAEHIRNNADIFDFEISDEDMAKINSFNLNFRTGPNPAKFNEGGGYNKYPNIWNDQ